MALRHPLAGGLPFRLLSSLNMDGFPAHVNQNQRNGADGDDANRLATSQPPSHHAGPRASRRNGTGPGSSRSATPSKIAASEPEGLLGPTAFNATRI